MRCSAIWQSAGPFEVPKWFWGTMLIKPMGPRSQLPCPFLCRGNIIPKWQNYDGRIKHIKPNKNQWTDYYHQQQMNSQHWLIGEGFGTVIFRGHSSWRKFISILQPSTLLLLGLCAHLALLKWTNHRLSERPSLTNLDNLMHVSLRLMMTARLLVKS